MIGSDGGSEGGRGSWREQDRDRGVKSVEEESVRRKNAVRVRWHGVAWSGGR